jgi:ABC-type transporter Mla subunit MlaD
MAPSLAIARKRRAVTILIAVVGLAVLVSFWFAKRSTYSLRLTTCFQNASGVSAGTTVKLAGVVVGRVNNVRAQPTEPACPAAVAMELQTPYQLKIPQDAIASIASDGIFSPDYLAIDVSHATGSAIGNGGRLPSKESERFTAATVDRMLKGIEFVKQLSDEEKKAELQQKKSSTHPRQSPSKPPQSK